MPSGGIILILVSCYEFILVDLDGRLQLVPRAVQVGPDGAHLCPQFRVLRL